ncbi:universal stress protein [Halorubrum sp. BOL3-1]|uniref:universal stress protein n=1 Tax=Halorubrum sp. BOL3-1 TaxID=2497325 RepID=UPI00100505E9|nr:universal stress protein [Halorubrum sp. BOL3-1]QAU12048.1 universal stress protein [Halorubrum sp. BOL3-1]
MYETILFPTDGSEATISAAKHAFSHAERYDAEIHVLSIVELASGLGTAGRDEAELDERRADRLSAAERIASQTAPDGVEATITVELGSPARVITEYVDQNAIDLVVMSTKGRSGAERIVFGSITDEVVRHADAPVLAVQR